MSSNIKSICVLGILLAAVPAFAQRSDDGRRGPASVGKLR